MFASQKLAGLRASFERVGMVRDVVALEYAPRAMTSDFHDDRLWDTGTA